MAKSEKLGDLAGQEDEDLVVVRLIALFAAATRLSCKKMSSLEEAESDTLTLADKFVDWVLES